MVSKGVTEMKFSATVTLQYDTPFSPFPASAWREGLDWIRDIGMDGAELCISHYRDLDVALIKEELDRRGLSCSTISTGQARALEGLSLIGVSEEVTKKTQERFQQHIDAAAILGSCVTIGLMRGLGTPETQEADLQALSEAMKPLIDYAERRGVVLMLEAINRYETALLNSAEADMDFIVNGLGDPNCVGVLWDLFHANIEDADFTKSIALMGKKLKHVHLADSNRMFPGYGHTDLHAVLRTVKDAGFEGYSSFECLNLPSRETVCRETGPWVAKMRQLL